MGEEHGHSAFKFALSAFAHVFNFIGDMFDVQRVETPGPEQLSLFVGPSDHVVVVTVHSVADYPRFGYHRSSFRPGRRGALAGWFLDGWHGLNSDLP